jgi:hypothetical protein
MPERASAAFRSTVFTTAMVAVSITVTVPSAQLATNRRAPVGEMARPVGSEPVLA